MGWKKEWDLKKDGIDGGMEWKEGWDGWREGWYGVRSKRLKGD